MADTLKAARTKFETTDKLFAKPVKPRAFAPLAPFAGKFPNPSIGKATLGHGGSRGGCGFGNPKSIGEQRR